MLIARPSQPGSVGSRRIAEDDGLWLLRGEPSAAALVTAEGTVTYGELEERVRARREQLGVQRRLVMVSCANAVEPLVTYLAALAGGHPVLLVAGDAGGHRAGLIESYDPDVVVAPSGDGWRLEERRVGSAHTFHPDLALLLSTSGSTGSPKLVRLSRQNVFSNAESIAEYLALTARDRAATTLPMHYCYGLSVVNSHLVAGASLLLTERSVIEPEFWDEFTDAGATSFAGVPYTFDLLDSIGFGKRSFPRLRYITQAGGRLAPDRVRAFARLGQERGFDFVVMYGQTEATARMAYLPPELAETCAGTIGIAIPNGFFRLDDLNEESVGELVYTGPNVMMGYAEQPADLALGRTAEELRTGDLARQRGDGLFEIVGRSSRFVKMYGLRIDLDRIERILADEAIDARAVNLDERLVVFVREQWAVGLVAPKVAEATCLPRHGIRVHAIDEFPLTSSGKSDIAALRRRAAHEETRDEAGGTGGKVSAEHIRALYAELLHRDARLEDSFVTLQGDSLSYVEVSLRLEQMLGGLPRDWQAKSALELSAGRAPTPQRTHRSFLRRTTARVETSLVLRAVAIVLITGTHANLFHVLGGSHLLLGVLGFNLARFQVADVPRAARVNKLLRVAVHVIVPAVLWIGTVALLTGMYDPATVFLGNSLFVGGGSWSVQWQFWFLEAFVWSVPILMLVLATPVFDKLERRWPFAFAAVLLAGALGLRLLLTGVQAGPTERYALPVVLWCIVLGWLIARSNDLKRRIASTAVVAVSVLGFFGDPAREAVVVVGLLLLVWIPALPVPRVTLPALRLLASASLFIYLVQWQVYPALEDDFPLLATLASLAAGIIAWRVYTAAQHRWTSRGRRPSTAVTEGQSAVRHSAGE